MSEVQQLYRLQQTDTEIKQKTARLGEVIKAQKETPQLINARKRAEAAVATLKKWQAEQRSLDLDLQSVNSKAKNSETRLYSGNVKNPKELSDLQKEIESLGRRRAALEEQLLEAMIMIEDAQVEEQEANGRFVKIKAAWEANQGDLKQEQNSLALRLHELAGIRKKQAANIATKTLDKYQALLKKKNGLAVVQLKRNTCQGCQVNVSSQKAKAVDERQLVYCGGCGRILSAA